MRVLGFTPVFWPTVISIPCFLVALALGTWQVQRLGWKQNLIDERTAQLGATPVPLPASIEPGDAALDFRRVRVTGSFLHEREMFLAARSLRGNTGYDVITPLKRNDGSVVLVDRGWVPEERKSPERRAEGQVAGEVTIDGVARTRFRKGYFQPDNEPHKNRWFWIDIAHMGQFAGVAPLPLIVEAGDGFAPGGWPKGGQTRVDLVNNHLAYVVTWYSMALTIVVIYVLWHRKREREEAAR